MPALLDKITSSIKVDVDRNHLDILIDLPVLEKIVPGLSLGINTGLICLICFV